MKAVEFYKPDHLFLVRHAETLHNGAKVLRGRQSARDVISPAGQVQARACGAWFAAQHLADPRVYASTYLRAQQTAQAIAEALGVGVTVLDGIHEMDVGDWVGRPYSAFRTHEHELLHGQDDFGFPDGEDVRGVTERTRAAIAQALAGGGTPIIVSHGLALRVMLADLLRVPFRRAWADGRFEHGNTAVTELVRKGESWQVMHLAQNGHLS